MTNLEKCIKQANERIKEGKQVEKNLNEIINKLGERNENVSNIKFKRIRKV